MTSIQTSASDGKRHEQLLLQTAAALPALRSSSKARLWVGRALSGLVVVFLVFDGIIKLIELPVVTETLQQLGYPGNVAFGLGVLTLVTAVLYAIPRTSLIGAILLTGLLGGAMATHLRVGSPLFTHFLFGAYIGLMAWGGLVLRDAGLWSLLMGRTIARANS